MEVKKKVVNPYQVTSDVIGHKALFVNYYMLGEPGEGNSWVLVDAGLPGIAERIMEEAEELYGVDNPPKAIVLTHGHFDHVGSLPELLKNWKKVKVYAHELEIPYLTGRSAYPPPDVLADTGGISLMSWTFPIKPINISRWVQQLPEDGSIPELPEWRYIHTPGHAPGHISLFRERDRVLIAGDAFVTTDQGSFLSVLTQKKKLHGPPPYFTINWEEALRSLKVLSDLQPRYAGCGHGLPVSGNTLRNGLEQLINVFEAREFPEYGRYRFHPAVTDEQGIKKMPAPTSFKVARYAAATFGVMLAIAIGYGLFRQRSE